MAREIVLDTETTGLDPGSGHRIIEIACVEVVDLMPTGNAFHRYVDPERDIDPDAERVHGISRHLLQGKPVFGDPDVGAALQDFVGDSALVAHNARFDRAFINMELERIGRPIFQEDRWVDTLALAQKRYPGAFNNLDALCKRFKVSLADREKHGALVDAGLLAQVYFELRGGRETVLDLGPRLMDAARASTSLSGAARARPRPLASRLTVAEREAHLAFVAQDLKNAIWLRGE
jgi:DNA polymerase-3 subunit epsilon